MVCGSEVADPKGSQKKKQHYHQCRGCKPDCIHSRPPLNLHPAHLLAATALAPLLASFARLLPFAAASLLVLAAAPLLAALLLFVLLLVAPPA
jgi:hypothetical protein